jgi:hypothetical protein
VNIHDKAKQIKRYQSSYDSVRMLDTTYQSSSSPSSYESKPMTARTEGETDRVPLSNDMDSAFKQLT